MGCLLPVVKAVMFWITSKLTMYRLSSLTLLVLLLFYQTEENCVARVVTSVIEFSESFLRDQPGSSQWACHCTRPSNWAWTTEAENNPTFIMNYLNIENDYKLSVNELYSCILQFQLHSVFYSLSRLSWINGVDPAGREGVEFVWDPLECVGMSICAYCVPELPRRFNEWNVLYSSSATCYGS